MAFGVVAGENAENWLTVKNAAPGAAFCIAARLGKPLLKGQWHSARLLAIGAAEGARREGAFRN
jgi:hypothetical protein